MSYLFSLFIRLLYLLNLLVLLVVITTYLPITISSWWLDNLLSLQLQWSLIALFLLLINITIGRKWLLMLSVLSLVAIIYQPLSSYASNQSFPLSKERLKVAQLNIRYKNDQIEQLLTVLNRGDYDLLALQEVADNWQRKIQPLRQSFPYSIGSGDGNSSPSGLVLFSRWPIVEQKIHHLGYRGSHIIEALVQSPQTEKPVQIFVLHPSSPRDATLWQQRNAELASVAQLVVRSPLPYKIVIGDLNTTPWSGQFKRFQQQSLLTNTSNHINYIPSWSYSDSNSLLRLLSSAYIDHCLISDHFSLLSKAQQSIAGSDHRLIVTELELLN